jgi:hypothetical protein
VVVVAAATGFVAVTRWISGGRDVVSRRISRSCCWCSVRGSDENIEKQRWTAKKEARSILVRGLADQKTRRW